jgi:hypothetical protein
MQQLLRSICILLATHCLRAVSDTNLDWLDVTATGGGRWFNPGIARHIIWQLALLPDFGEPSGVHAPGIYAPFSFSSAFAVICL